MVLQCNATEPIELALGPHCTAALYHWTALHCIVGNGQRSGQCIAVNTGHSELDLGLRCIGQMVLQFSAVATEPIDLDLCLGSTAVHWPTNLAVQYRARIWTSAAVHCNIALVK